MRWSIELAPTGLIKPGSVTARLLPFLPGGTRVYLPALPVDPPDAIEQALLLLKREASSMVPVPHVAAARTASSVELEKRLCAWQRAYGDNLREVLVVRGETVAHHGDPAEERTVNGGLTAATQIGPYSSSLELLQSGMIQRCGISAVSVCGHPEGVGGLSPAEARAALLPKLQWAADEGVTARVVLQFCFAADTTTAFVDGLRAAGVTADVSVGIVGPSPHDFRTRMAQRCSVAPPPRREDLGEWPSAYVRKLAEWQTCRPAGAGMQSLHVYPFGGLRRTLDWLRDEVTGCEVNGSSSSADCSSALMALGVVGIPNLDATGEG